MHKGHPVAAGSKILEGFISPIDATVVTKLEAAGVCILGKANMDEFGTSGLFGGPRNPSGAVSAVAGGIADFALLNDYTGAASREAAALGICYIRPTYGTVSRYGLVPAAPSMDQIGIASRTPEDGLKALAIIAGHDPKDGASLPDAGHGTHGGVASPSSAGHGTHGGAVSPSSAGRSAHGERETERAEPGRICAAVPKCALEEAAGVALIPELGKLFRVVEIELEHKDVYAQVMQILCSVELSANISRYDGIKYGYRAGGFGDLRELYTRSRDVFGEETKLAALLGAMVLSQENYARYYDKAMRVRRLIKESLGFGDYDVLICPHPAAPAGQGSVPGAAGSASLAGSASQASPDEAPICPALPCLLPQLCGLPAVTMPLGGGAVTLIAGFCREDLLFEAAKAVGI